VFEDFFPQFPLLNLLRAEFDRHNSVSGKKTEETNGQINDIRSGSSRARGVRVDKRQIPPGKVGLPFYRATRYERRVRIQSSAERNLGLVSLAQSQPCD